MSGSKTLRNAVRQVLQNSLQRSPLIFSEKDMRSFLSRLACVAAVMGTALSARAVEPKYLPPNSEVAITVNLKQILNSDLVKDKKDLVDQAKAFLKQKLDESPAKEYLDKAGFDLFRDLDSVTVTSDGSKDPNNGFVIIEGTFNADKLVEVAKEAATKSGDNLKVTKAGNVNVFEITPKDNEKTIYSALINNSLMIAAASREQLNAAIARINSNKTPNFRANFKTALETTNSKQSFSFVASGEGLAKMAESAPKQPGGDFGAMLQNMDGMAMSISLTKDVTFQLAGTAKTEEDAKKMAAAANFGLIGIRGMVIQQAKQDAKVQPVADIANTLRITTQGNTIVLRGEVSQANLDKMLTLIPR